MASNMDEKKSGLLTRRQALLSIATITAGAAVLPRAVFGATPAKDKIKFIAIGDFGTGDDNQTGIAAQMLRDHKTSPLDFWIAVGDNIYPDGDGLAEFFMIDSTAFDMAQAGWLEGVLKESTAKWKIAVFHHPIYSSAGEHGSDLGLRGRIEPLLTRYGVNVVLSGHDHVYERVKPQQGVQYFVTGAGGKVRHGDVNMRSPFRAMSYDQDNHYLQMVIEDQQINFQTIARSGAVIDRGAITPRAMAASVR